MFKIITKKEYNHLNEVIDKDDDEDGFECFTPDGSFIPDIQMLNACCGHLKQTEIGLLSKNQSKLKKEIRS